jgi:hypothetical protein
MRLVDTVAPGRETDARGKHRTEGTEVTEEGWGVAVGTYASPHADTPYADPPTRFSPRPTPTRRPVSARPGSLVDTVAFVH